MGVRFPSPALAALAAGGAYQACVVPQLGHPTVVDTEAVNVSPQAQR
jgi:hypothetical protein